MSGGAILGILVIGALVALVNAIGVLLTLLATYWYLTLFVAIAVASPFMIIELRRREHQRVRDAKLHDLQQLLSSLVELKDDNAECWSKIANLRAELAPSVPNLDEILCDSYIEIVVKILDDGVVDEAEVRFLRTSEQSLGLAHTAISGIKKQAYLKYYRLAISDSALSEPEERSLAMLRQSLGIEDSAIAKENAVLEDLSAVRNLAGKDLVEVSCDLSLKAKETCFHETDCQEYKRSTSAGVYSYGPGERGDLHITSQRLCFRGPGGSLSVPLKDIIGVRYADTLELLEIVKDGRQTPYYFKCDKPILALQFIRLAKERTLT